MNDHPAARILPRPADVNHLARRRAELHQLAIGTARAADLERAAGLEAWDFHGAENGAPETTAATLSAAAHRAEQGPAQIAKGVVHHIAQQVFEQALDVAIQNAAHSLRERVRKGVCGIVKGGLRSPQATPQTSFMRQHRHRTERANRLPSFQTLSGNAARRLIALRPGDQTLGQRLIKRGHVAGQLTGRPFAVGQQALKDASHIIAEALKRGLGGIGSIEGRPHHSGVQLAHPVSNALDHVGHIGVADDRVIEREESVADKPHLADNALQDFEQLALQPAADSLHGPADNALDVVAPFDPDKRQAGDGSHDQADGREQHTQRPDDDRNGPGCDSGQGATNRSHDWHKSGKQGDENPNRRYDSAQPDDYRADDRRNGHTGHDEFLSFRREAVEPVGEFREIIQ